MRGYSIDGDARVQIAHAPGGGLHAVSMITSGAQAEHFRRNMTRQGCTVTEMSAIDRRRMIESGRAERPGRLAEPAVRPVVSIPPWEAVGEAQDGGAACPALIPGIAPPPPALPATAAQWPPEPRPLPCGVVKKAPDVAGMASLFAD